MNCNCNNNGTGNATTNIRVVGGNVLRLAIPLTLRTIELVDNELVNTDTDFIPSSDYAVVVELSKGNIKIPIVASMDGNVAYIEDKGTIPVGTYSITVTCKDSNGNPYRFKQATALSIVDTTAEAGIELPIEYETATWYLDAALYLALKGEDGVGIDNITTQTSDEIGGYNYVTITLTDGRTTTFTVVNGSGRVDDNLDTQSPYPIANSVVATKFDQIDNSIGDLFGAVNYDSQSRTIRFYDKSGTRLLATLDAHPFIKDGMVSRAYISNNTLVILFNTDSEHDPITIPLSSVFNPNNYYTITQVNNLLANYYNKSSVDSMVNNKATLLSDGRMPLSQFPPVVLDDIYYDASVTPPLSSPERAYHTISNDKHQIVHYAWVNAGYSMQKVAVFRDCDPLAIYYNKDDETFYRYDSEDDDLVSIEIGGGTVTAVKMNNGTPIEPDSNGVVDLGTVLTEHQSLSGYATTSAMNTALASKQDTLTFDNVPVQNSNNPVKSGGVYSELASITSQIEALDAQLNPYTLSLSASSTLLEYTGNAQNVTYTATMKRGSTTVTPDSVSVTCNGSSSSTSTLTVGLTNRGSYSASASATKDGTTKTASASTKVMHAMRIGFGTSTVSPTSYTKQTLKNSVSGTYTATNGTAGYYLWICVDDTLTVSSVKSGGFDVPMESATTSGGYKCYRSSEPLEAGSMTITLT